MGQLSFGNPDCFLQHDMIMKKFYDRGRFLNDWFYLRGRGILGKTTGAHSKCLIIIIVLLALISIVLFLLYLKQYRKNKRMKIMQLQDSYNFMLTICLRQDSVALRSSSAVMLGQMESVANGTGMGDYQTVKRLIHLVSQLPPDAPYFDDVAREVRELRVAWNTMDWKWAVRIQSGNAEKIISDIKARILG